MASAQNARIVLRWKDVPGASAYEVQIARDPAFVEVVLQTRTTTAGYRWEQLPTTTHWWRVRSFDTEGRASEWSPPRTLAVDTAIPTPLKPTDGASIACGSTVSLELDSSPLVKEYLVELSTTSEFAGIRTLRSTTPNFELPGLNAGTWHWRTRAVDIKGRTTDAGPVRSFVVKVSPPKLKTVADVTLGVPQVQLSWGEAGCAASYVVEATHDGKDKISIPAQLPNMAFKAGVAGEYRWRVAALDDRGSPGDFSPESVFRVKLATPIGKSESAGTALNTRVDVSWSSVPTATTYRVELVRMGEKALEPVANGNVTGTSWRSGELIPGEYKWRVSAKDALGHTSSPSEWRAFIRSSGNALATPKFLEPLDDRVVSIGSEVELAWSGVEDAVNYELEIDGSPSKLPGRSAKTAPLAEGAHHVRVRAIGPGYRLSDWTSPLELFAGVPPVVRADVKLVGEQVRVTLFDVKNRPVSGGNPAFTMRNGSIGEVTRLGDLWVFDWSPPLSNRDVLTITSPGFKSDHPLESTLDPFITTAVRAGGIFNAGGVASPYFGAGLTLRLPIFSRHPGIELRVGAARAAATADFGGTKLQAEAWMLPLSFLLAWHHNIGAFQLKGGVGAVIQPIWVNVGADSTFNALPGIEGVLSLSRRFGPGRLEGEVSFLYSRLEGPLARLNAGGLAVRVGYAFDL